MEGVGGGGDRWTPGQLTSVMSQRLPVKFAGRDQTSQTLIDTAAVRPTQRRHCAACGPQNMTVMSLRLFLPPSPPHTHFGAIIPPFSPAVRSCFTPVRPYWLPFCPISPPLTRLSVINTDSRPLRGGLPPHRCQRWSSTPRSCTLGRLSRPPRIVRRLSAESGGPPFTLNTAAQRARAAHRHRRPREGSQHNGGGVGGGVVSVCTFSPTRETMCLC